MKSVTTATKKYKKPRRPARSVKEIYRRRQGDAYKSFTDRLLYAIFNSVLYATIGFIIDISIAICTSILGVGSGKVFWLFAPFMLILGAILGFFMTEKATADTMDVFNHDDAPHIYHLDSYSVRHDFFKGIAKGILIFAVIWFVMMLRV